MAQLVLRLLHGAVNFERAYGAVSVETASWRS